VSRRRGQLVVVAALALAIALVPMALAYLQLGYDDDVRATTTGDDALVDTERTLQRALVDASTDVPSRHDWSERDDAVGAARDALRPTVHSLATTAVDSDTVVTVEYNESHASAWADANCPSGPGREFGRCVSDRGVVVQNRTGQTHVLAIAVDVTVTTTDTERATTTVVAVRS